MRRRFAGRGELLHDPVTDNGLGRGTQHIERQLPDILDGGTRTPVHRQHGSRRDRIAHGLQVGCITRRIEVLQSVAADRHHREVRDRIGLLVRIHGSGVHRVEAGRGIEHRGGRPQGGTA